MTEKRFKCRCYEKDSSVKIYDNSEIILDISYRDFDDAFYCSRKLKSVIDKLNTLVEENEQLRKDLIDHSALISMLEDYQALKIEDTLWNLTDAKSEEEFNELYKPYLEKAKRCWR